MLNRHILYYSYGIYRRNTVYGMSCLSTCEVCISKGSSPDKPQTEVHTSDESMIKTSVANIEPNGVQKNTIVKCIKRSKMRYPLESYISLFKHKGVLVDWWDDDQVCFELKSKDDQIEAL